MSSSLYPSTNDIPYLYQHLNSSTSEVTKSELQRNVSDLPNHSSEVLQTCAENGKDPRGQDTLYNEDIKEESDEDSTPEGETDEIRMKFDIDVLAEGMCLKKENEVTWGCRKCRPKIVFPTFEEFICHTVKIHQNSYLFKCKICKEVINGTSSLVEHIERHSEINLGFVRKKAREEPPVFTDIYPEVKLDSPINNLTENPEFDMSDSDASSENVCLSAMIYKKITYEGQEMSIKEIVDDDGRTSYKCDNCEKLFDQAELCAKHISKKHRQKPIFKKRPKKNRKTKSFVKTKTRVDKSKPTKSTNEGDKPKKKHLCSYCGKTFSLSYKLKKHYRVHTGEKPYHCSQCGKNFSSCSNLKRHVLIHSGEKPYLCTYCGKSFNHPTTFKTHSYIHAGSRNIKLKQNLKRFSCEFCDKSFAARSTLTIHIRVHTKERPYQCNTCCKSFAQKSALTQHLLNHTGEKPHTCSYCMKTFKTLVCLKTHVRTHTGERPYKCGVCEKAFSSQSNLYRHRATHTGLKRFSCDYCCKEFSQRSALGDHINIHTGARPYCCPHCSSCFANKSTLVKHVAIHMTKLNQK